MEQIDKYNTMLSRIETKVLTWPPKPYFAPAGFPGSTGVVFSGN
jgi:hypothetical protein